MIRRIIGGLVLVLLVYLGWTWYRSRTEKVKLYSGDYSCVGCLEGEAKARFLKENAGETADGNSERKLTSAAIAAEQATSGSAPVSASVTAPVAPVIVAPGNTGSSSMVAPQSLNTSSTPAPGPVPVPAALPTRTSSRRGVSDTYGGSTSSIGVPPVMDSVSPNPRNDVHFRGAGSFEWYREGNITWRVDTTTGHSCIVYATMEEWRKQIVMSHGCGHNA